MSTPESAGDTISALLNLEQMQVTKRATVPMKFVSPVSYWSQQIEHPMGGGKPFPIKSVKILVL